MVQSFNSAALFSIIRVLIRPYLLLPQTKVPSISNISFKGLKECGVKGIIFDKDNTLTAPYALSIYPSISEAFEEAKREFEGRCVIMSNSAGTNDDVDFQDALKIEGALGLPVLRHKDKKPEGIDSVKQFFGKDTDLESLCVVGDRLFTDVLMGNFHGMMTICTEELTSVGDNKMAKFIRSLESACLRHCTGYEVKHSLFDATRIIKPHAFEIKNKIYMVSCKTETAPVSLI